MATKDDEAQQWGGPDTKFTLFGFDKKLILPHLGTLEKCWANLAWQLDYCDITRSHWNPPFSALSWVFVFGIILGATDSHRCGLDVCDDMERQPFVQNNSGVF